MAMMTYLLFASTGITSTLTIMIFRQAIIIYLASTNINNHFIFLLLHKFMIFRFALSILFLAYTFMELWFAYIIFVAYALMIIWFPTKIRSFLTYTHMHIIFALSSVLITYTYLMIDLAFILINSTRTKVIFRNTFFLIYITRTIMCFRSAFQLFSASTSMIYLFASIIISFTYTIMI